MFVREGWLANASTAHLSGFFSSGGSKQWAADRVAGDEAGIHKVCCTLESPGQLLKHPYAQIAPQNNQIPLVGWEPGFDSFKNLQVFSMCPRAWEPLCYMIPSAASPWLFLLGSETFKVKNWVSKMLSRQHLSNLSMHRNNPESFLKHRVLGPTSRESDLVGLGWDLSFRISNLPGGAGADDLRLSFE